MMIAHESRLIMGPGRQGEVYSIVGLSPDGEQLLFSPLDLLSTDPFSNS